MCSRYLSSALEDEIPMGGCPTYVLAFRPPRVEATRHSSSTENISKFQRFNCVQPRWYDPRTVTAQTTSTIYIISTTSFIEKHSRSGLQPSILWLYSRLPTHSKLIIQLDCSANLSHHERLRRVRESSVPTSQTNHHHHRCFHCHRQISFLAIRSPTASNGHWERHLTPRDVNLIE